MTDPLSPRARRFAELLRALNRRRVQLTELWRAFDRADPSSQMSLGRRRLLVVTLDELETAGVITLPSAQSYDRAEQPAAPKFVLVEQVPQERPDAPEIVWHPELSWAEDTPMTVAQREQLATINTWLFRGRDDLVVPLHERSLEIFDEERVLDAILTTQVFADNRPLSLDTLRARRVVPPHGTHRARQHASRDREQRHLRLHHPHARPIARPGRPGRLGAGGAFEASVLSIVRLESAVAAVRYFGDLDRAGLRIPANADRLARASGLPPVQPASELYDALFQEGKRRASQQPVPADIADELVRWLDARHRSSAADLPHLVTSAAHTARC